MCLLLRNVQEGAKKGFDVHISYSLEEIAFSQGIEAFHTKSIELGGLVFRRAVVAFVGKGRGIHLVILSFQACWASWNLAFIVAFP